MSTTPPKAVLFLGPEEGEKQQAIQEIRGHITKISGEEPEEHRRYAFDTTMAEVVDLLHGGSLFGTYTLVWYRSVELIRTKDDIRRLKEYLKEPAPNATLILETPEIRVDRGLEQAVGSGNKRIFWEMFDSQKQGWVTAYVRRHGGQIDPEAAELLLELVPNNTLEMGHELDRLMAFVGRRIAADDVDRYIYHGREESVFTLFDSVVEGDLERSLEIATKILADSEAFQLIAGITWQFDRLSQLHALRHHGIPDAQAFDGSNLNIRSKRSQKLYAAGAKRYSGSDAIRILRTLNDFDALLRNLPVATHNGLVAQVLYSIICRHGKWTPSRAVDA